MGNNDIQHIQIKGQKRNDFSFVVQHLSPCSILTKNVTRIVPNKIPAVLL